MAGWGGFGGGFWQIGGSLLVFRDFIEATFNNVTSFY
jgi:hypothetical protein